MANYNESREFIPNVELPEISKDLLRKTITSVEFKNKLIEAINLYNKNNREYGFAIIKNPQNDDVWFGDVVAGQARNETDLSKSANPVNKKLQSLNIDGHNFIDFHIHPYDYGEVIAPSIDYGQYSGDLYDNNKDRIYIDPINFDHYIIPSISLIATPTKKQINILAFRQPLKHNPLDLTESMAEMEDIIEYAQTQEEIITAMKQIGYLVTMMQTDLDYNFDEESISKFEQLAYKPIQTPRDY